MLLAGKWDIENASDVLHRTPHSTSWILECENLLAELPDGRVFHFGGYLLLNQE